jgi:hypothetical protein
LVQIFAWGRMITEHSQTMPISQAIAKTFDGEMCGICQMVADAQKQERSRSDVPQGQIEIKTLLFFQTAPQVIVEAPRGIAWRPSDSRETTVERSAPPVPPPRWQNA